jgi:diguanylate cyclase
MSNPARLPAPNPDAARSKPGREGGRKDPALLFAHAAMGAMLEHGVSPTPSNYLIWYSYHSDSTPGLRPAMEARLEGPITQDWLDELYGQFFAVEREAHSLQEVAARLESAVNEAVGLILDAREDALRYGGTLDQASSRLAAEPASISVLLRRLVAETQEVSRRTEEAGRKLDETSRKTREMQHELAEARRLASTDPLTGLANRRQLDEALREWLAGHRPTCLVMVDLDHFKAVNDTHGHPAGDQVLRQFAAILGEWAGDGALPARFGGEEFALILPLNQVREAVAVAERIRARINQSPMVIRPTGQRLSVTASLGVAMASPGELPAQLIERADAALYEAKRGGRNRVCSHPPLPKAESVWN